MFKFFLFLSALTMLNFNANAEVVVVTNDGRIIPSNNLQIDMTDEALIISYGYLQSEKEKSNRNNDRNFRIVKTANISIQETDNLHMPIVITDEIAKTSGFKSARQMKELIVKINNFKGHTFVLKCSTAANAELINSCFFD